MSEGVRQGVLQAEGLEVGEAEAGDVLGGTGVRREVPYDLGQGELL